MVNTISAQVMPVPPAKSRALPITLVPAPGRLTATQEKDGVMLSWQDHSNGKAACRIERKAGKDGVYQDIANVNAGISNFQDRVQSGKTYFYRVRAYIGFGKDIKYSAYSNEVSANVPAIAVLGPAITRPATIPKIGSQTGTPAGGTPKALSIPAVINAPGTLTVTGGKAASAPTAGLNIPAVVNAPGTLTVTGGTPAPAATAVLTIPVVINLGTALTVTGQSQ